MTIKTWEERYTNCSQETAMQAEIDELRDALEKLKQQEPEPVMPNGYTTITCPACGFEGGREIEPAYVPLSDEQIDMAYLSVDYTQPYRDFRIAVGRAIEKAVRGAQ